MLDIPLAPTSPTTADGRPGVLYWLRVQGGHALLRRERAARQVAEHAWAEPPTAEQMAAALLETGCADSAEDAQAIVAQGFDRWHQELAAEMWSRPYVRLLPLTNGQVRAARSRSSVLASAFDLDLEAGSARMRTDPQALEDAFARQMISENVPEVHNVRGVRPDGSYEPVTTGAELLDFVDKSQNPLLAGLASELYAALTTSARLRPGLGEASAWLSAG